MGRRSSTSSYSTNFKKQKRLTEIEEKID